MESNGSSVSMSWSKVLDQLLKLVCEPVTHALLGHKVIFYPNLTKYCCHLLARVVAELVHQCSSTDVSNVNLYNL